jgi:hypothetical protein
MKVDPTWTWKELHDHLQDRIAELEKALRAWTEADGGNGLHLDNCDYSQGLPCTCGLDSAKAALNPTEGTS